MLPRTRGQATAIALAVLAAVALVVNARVAVVNMRRMTDASVWVGRTHEVIEAVQGLLSGLQDAETGQRGFLITGEQSYLEPYERGRTRVQWLLARLDELTRDDPELRQSIEQLRPLVAGKLVELEHTVALRRSGAGGFEKARAAVLTDAGKRLMDVLRVKIADLRAHEQQLLEGRVRASAAAARTAIVSSVAGLAVSLGLLVAAFVALRRRLMERERAARALHDEKERFRITLTSIGDAVVVTDGQGRITMMNAFARSLLGWDDDALGRPLDEVFRIVDEDTRHARECPVEKALRDGQASGLANHTLLIRRDGSELPIDDSGAPIRDDRGSIIGVVLVFRDIRERRETERELQRRAELLQEQDRRKDAFLAMLSHELRNPLVPIRNSVTVLQRADPGSEQAKRALGVVDRQVMHLTRLVDDLLDVSRIAQGKIRLQKERLDLAEVVRRTVDDLRSVFASKQVALELRDGGEPLWVDADATRVAQVTGNLLQNAVKFTGAGGRVTVAVRKENDQALLRVRDTGVGIDPATLARLFQPFVQAEGTLHRTPGGLGLGLAVSKSIIELHGGTVRGSSDGPGRGAEFVVALPLMADAAVGPVQQAKPPEARRLRILVIDDNEDSATTMRDLLELEGHQVELASDGQRGMEAALASCPDVVLSDVGLPGLDGYEVARRLRAAGSTALLVALTGYTLPEDVQRSQEAGFHHHLGKPPDLARLAEILVSAPASR